MAVLLVPAAASSFGAWFGTRRPRVAPGSAGRPGRRVATPRIWRSACGGRCARRTRRCSNAVTRRSRAASFLAAHAADGAKLFNAFNDGPWLLWMTAPRIQHYVDPRNHLGAEFLRQYQVETCCRIRRASSARSARTGARVVLVRDRDPRMQALARHLAQSRDWPLVYWNGEHAIHARRVAAEPALIELSRIACCGRPSTSATSPQPGGSRWTSSSRPSSSACERIAGGGGGARSRADRDRRRRRPEPRAGRGRGSGAARGDRRVPPTAELWARRARSQRRAPVAPVFRPSGFDRRSCQVVSSVATVDEGGASSRGSGAAAAPVGARSNKTARLNTRCALQSRTSG